MMREVVLAGGAVFALLGAAISAQPPPPVTGCAPRIGDAPLPTPAAVNATLAAEPTRLGDAPAFRVSIAEGGAAPGGAVIFDLPLENGTLEVDLYSDLAPDAPAGSRGFAGLAFRATPDLSSYEAIYLRPTNGRAEEQIRRNHATQYISHPDYPWYRLREEMPGHYESYVDIVPRRWTHIRIDVEGAVARLFVDCAEQPVLIVNDLKLGDNRGGLTGFWIGSGTVAHFANFRVSPAPR